MKQKHEALFEHFSGIFTENKHEQSLEDCIETLLMLHYNNQYQPVVLHFCAVVM